MRKKEQELLPISTSRRLDQARHLLADTAAHNKIVLFVGGGAKIREVVRAEAERICTPHVTLGWLGGTLTNFDMTRARLDRLAEIERWERDGTINRYSKWEQTRLQREKRRLIERCSGLRTMAHLPAAVFIVDPRRESAALGEARKIGAATVALTESRSDSKNVDVPILAPENEPGFVQTVVKALADAVLEGRSRVESQKGPKDPRAGSTRHGRRPPEEPGPGTAGVPARLRPRPTPGNSSVKRRSK